MQTTDDICERCGGVVRVGDWPFCRGNPSAHVPALNFGEEPLEAYVDNHVDKVPREITTRSERRRIMAKNNLEYVPKLPRLGAVTYIDMARKS